MSNQAPHGMLIAAALSLVPLMAQTATPSARIVGRVIGEAGVGVANARVHVSTAPSKGMPGRHLIMVRSGADGGFVFPQVPTGPLRLCVAPVGTNLVGTCEWLPAVDVEPKNAETVRLAPIQLPDGHRLKVRLNDARGLVEAEERAKSGRILMVAALAPYVPLIPVLTARKTASGRELEVVIPYDTDVQLLLNAGGYVVSAGAHGIANRSQSVKIPVRVDKRKPASDVVLTVTGVE